MGILNKLKQAAAELMENIPASEYKFTQSSNFRGFKRFHVSYYGYEPAEKGLKRLMKRGPDLTGAEIVLKPVRREDCDFLDVIVNGNLIGSVTFWTPDPKKDAFINNYLYKGKVDKAHVRIEVDGFGKAKVNLFLHPKE